MDRDITRPVLEGELDVCSWFVALLQELDDAELDDLKNIFSR